MRGPRAGHRRWLPIGIPSPAWAGALGGLLAFGLALFPVPAGAGVNLTFGVYATDRPADVVGKFRPILNVLETALSQSLDEPVTIKMSVAGSYKAGIRALVTGAVDFARFGPASYVESKRLNPGISILAVETEKGGKLFYGIICTARDSSIRSVSDLRGKSFAFGDKRSTIGRYLSQLYLLRQGLTARDLGYYEYLGRHDKVGIAVAAGRFSAGALKEGTFRKLIAKGYALREIARFPNVTKPWIARAGLAQRISRALRRGLLGMRDAEALRRLGKDGFVAGDDGDYASIREAIGANGKFFK